MMRKLSIVAVVLSTLLWGCATQNKKVGISHVNKVKVEGIPEIKRTPPLYASSGSIWVDSSFYTDLKARRVGDIVTIIVKEQARSKDSGVVESKKDSSFKTIIKTLFGIKDEVSDITGLKDPTNLLDLSSSYSYKGSGKTEQSSVLETKITAVVTQVLPNGNLVIEGKRTILVNGERKIIGIRGVVRPYDIAPDNTISSEYIANAEIVYEGKGVVSKSQSPLLFTRLLLWLWPLF